MSVKKRLMNDISRNVVGKASQHVSPGFASGVMSALETSVNPTHNLKQKTSRVAGTVINGAITAMRYQQAMKRLGKYMPNNGSTTPNGPSGPSGP